MHSLEIITDYSRYSFKYNSDLSGQVFIEDISTYERIEIDGEALLKFLAEIIRSKRISEIEQIDWKELIK
jgi:hypothetical protein